MARVQMRPIRRGVMVRMRPDRVSVAMVCMRVLRPRVYVRALHDVA